MTDHEKQKAGHAKSGSEGVGDESSRKIDPRLLEILVCPMTKGPLEYKADSQELISHRADLVFPIRNGVPLMTPDAARPLTEAERAKAKATKR